MADKLRRNDLTQQGITIIRFENKDVIANPPIVSDAVLGFVEGARE